MNIGTADIIRGNSRNLPLTDNSVDLVVTSPPYFTLRSYQDGGEHYAGQIGDESTPDEFVSSLLEVTAECVRVLKPSGSLWVNLGDKYGLNKSLLGLPWRYANRCIDDLRLILRAEVIWSKPNGQPESVTDRVRRSHEQWFHFTLQPRYFSAVDEIREPHRSESGREGKGALGGQKTLRPTGPNSGAYNALGALPGSVWTVPTEPLKVPDSLGVDHFAAFPTEWPKRIIQGWSPPDVCVECGEGRRPIVAKDYEHINTTTHAKTARGKALNTAVRTGSAGNVSRLLASITGYACACGQFGPNDCACCGAAATTTISRGGASVPVCLRHYNHWRTPTKPAVVLDPFGSTGTTAMVAKALGRRGISVDMSADYCRLAVWRTNDRDQLAKVLGIAKAEQQPSDQLDLFGGDAA